MYQNKFIEHEIKFDLGKERYLKSFWKILIKHEIVYNIRIHFIWH
jgi:hypothetical protein